NFDEKVNQFNHFKYRANKHANQLTTASIDIDDFIQIKFQVTSRPPTTASFAYYAVHENVMGQAASIHRNKTPHATFCKSSFTGLAKRGVFAFSKRQSRNEDFEVYLKHTAPRKLSAREKSIPTPICHDCSFDGDD
uniref:Vitellogenin domain-containing protein n=1 Tax=Mesocestoides corti TaxID=53468 RepID=A0A5K3G522_MESCO